MLHIIEGLNHEVLALEYEALSCFGDFTLGHIRIFAQLDIFTCRYLSLLLDFLAIDFIAHLMTVRERIILANLTQKIGRSYLSCHERLLELESFLFHTNGNVELRIGLVRGEQIFSSQVCWLRHPNER